MLTRKLGIRFILIDSLCILQDDSTDWHIEVGKMGDIYAYAHCTIAASSATQEGEGTFEQHVEEGELSNRGWILQERALSRRTIHLTGRQTYWECGSVLWSKTDDRGFRPANRLASSFFPQVSGRSDRSKEGLLTAVHDIFAHYSKLSLTNPTDKPVAIMGLEHRLQSFYNSYSYYGVFEEVFAESLLWRRSQESWLSPLIDFKADIHEWSVAGYRIPSWSWMAYTGEIRFHDHTSPDALTYATDLSIIRGDGEKRSDRGGVITITYTRNVFALSAPLLHLPADCVINRAQDSNCEIRHGHDVVGWARYDCDDAGNQDCRHCISLAQGEAQAWPAYAAIPSSRIDATSGNPFRIVLLLMPVEADIYRRIGVAVVAHKYLASSENMARVF